VDPTFKFPGVTFILQISVVIVTSTIDI